MTLCTSPSTRSQWCYVLSAALALALALAPALGCGGARSEAPLAPAASEGDEPPPEPGEAAEGEGEERSGPRAQNGRGSIVVTAKVDGQPVAARVKVLEGSSGAEGAAGEPISLPAGDQRISVSIAEPQALLDKPTQKLSVHVEPGKPTAVEVTFRWARVRLDVLVGGRSQASVPVKLFRNGEAVAEMKSGAAPQAISPGKYEADVILRGRTIHVTGLTFLESAEQTVPVRAQL